MENLPRRRASLTTPRVGFGGRASCAIPIIDSVQFQIIDDTTSRGFGQLSNGTTASCDRRELTFPTAVSAPAAGTGIRDARGLPGPMEEA